ILDTPHLGARLVEEAFGLRACLADDELPFLFGLLPDLVAQLLRGDQRVIDRLVSFTKRSELFVKPARLGVEILIDARQPLELLGDLIAELVDALGIVAADRLAELVSARIERREMEGLVDHADRAPKRTVPSRTQVAPSSTASS